MSSQVYQVPSATTPGKAYRVTVHSDGVLSCDCPDATYRRRQCKHQRQVLVLWTEAGRSGAFTAPASAPAPTHDYRTADECTCGYHCDRPSSLDFHIIMRNAAVAS